MSVCYLVRLGRPLWWNDKESGISDAGTFQIDKAYARAFATRAAAERFTRDHFPIIENPFDNSVFMWWESSKDKQFWPTYYYAIQEFQERSLETLCDWILEAGLDPPGRAEREDPTVWPLWWELVTDGKDFLACLRLSQQLGLPAWSAGLTDVRSWMAEKEKSTWMPGDGTLRFFWCEPFPLSEWRKLLQALGVEPKPWPQSTRDWEIWWDTYVREYDTATQTLLWWALVPYPYEIVEVELEDER